MALRSRSIKIWVLPHLPLHFLPLFFVVEKYLAVAEVISLDFALGFVEQRFETGDRAAAGQLFAPFFELFGLLRAEGGEQDFVVKREKLPVRAGIALPAAAADELTVDPLRLVQLGADDVQAAELGTPSPSRISVPRPAMFVATVTLPRCPAAATISASFSTCRALSTACSTPRASSNSDNCSLLSIDRVPTSTGRPSACCSRMSSMIACHLSSAVPNTSVGSFSRIGGRLVGTGTTLTFVDLAELAGAGAGGARHASQSVVAQEEILHGDPRGLRSGERDFDAFLGFDGLVNAGPPLAALAQAGR